VNHCFFSFGLNHPDPSPSSSIHKSGIFFMVEARTIAEAGKPRSKWKLQGLLRAFAIALGILIEK
jgi:hypothetical protein